MAWLLKKGVICVVDRVIESAEFSLGVRRMKAACMDVGVEGGKHVVWEQVSIGKFTLGESSALADHTQAMHASVKTFVKTDFASYLHLMS